MPIEIKEVSYLYEPGTPMEKEALDHVSLTFYEGQFTALIGHTGSGKSTLIQLLNGLLKPSEGDVLYNGESIFASVESIEAELKAGRKMAGLSKSLLSGKRKRLSKKELREEKARRMREIRRKVGLVFQYPEHQLFEMTVADDVAFGPKNLGLSDEEVNARVKKALKMVGMDIEEDPALGQKSPFELSGGQKRRVAIAGVLAMEPEFLILDEPTAGLDPKGRDEILGEVAALRKEQGIAVILVSHSMEDVAKFADRIVAVEGGKIVLDGTPREVFSHKELLEKVGLGVPQMTELSAALKERGFDIPDVLLTQEEVLEAVLPQLKKAGTSAAAPAAETDVAADAAANGREVTV